MIEDISRAKNLVLWLLELFPCVYPSNFRIQHDPRRDTLEWKYKKANSDRDDLFTLVLYGVRRAFFKKVVEPRILEKIEGINTTILWAGEERVILTFEPEEKRKNTLTLGGKLSCLETLQRDFWPQRDVTGNPNYRRPPQE